jgi:hypothetical protein
MARLLSALLLAGLFIVAAPARAFTPESGWWWNPDQPGIGFSIEIQDDFVFMVAFAYNQGGGATWYAAQGQMADRAFFSAPLYRRDNGTCLGCPFVPPSNTYAVGENIAIEFDTETTGVMTWAGRTIPVERQDYYLSRTPGIDPKTELWLGEWQVVLDWQALGGEFDEFPFVGDVIVYDLLDRDGDTDLLLGCRPENSEVGACSQDPVRDASGFYNEPDDSNILFVRENSQVFIVYEVKVGTSQFDGYAKRCPDNLDNYFTQCLDNDAQYPVLPARGWRSASRAFVQGDDDAPSSVPATPKTTSLSAARAAPALPKESNELSTIAPRQRANPSRSSELMSAALARMAESRKH